MEKIKKPKSIKAFIWTVAFTMLIVFLSYALTIYVCYRMQQQILPDSQGIWLHTQTVMADGTVSETTMYSWAWFLIIQVTIANKAVIFQSLFLLIPFYYG